MKLGLVDAIGSPKQVLTDEFGSGITFWDVSPKRTGLAALLKTSHFSTDGDWATRVAQAAVREAAGVVEDKALWARFGL